MERNVDIKLFEVVKSFAFLRFLTLVLKKNNLYLEYVDFLIKKKIFICPQVCRVTLEIYFPCGRTRSISCRTGYLRTPSLTW